MKDYSNSPSFEKIRRTKPHAEPRKKSGKKIRDYRRKGERYG